jgi:hypothetical protein
MSKQPKKICKKQADEMFGGIFLSTSFLVEVNLSVCKKKVAKGDLEIRRILMRPCCYMKPINRKTIKY